ncbi:MULTISPECIES: hypothetical protein [unclassified Cupriavidus]|uniref:hypothetical protein n=1 Tax=unclassified Cupriavidus TaxID=2640874 RepID=UPI00313EBF75
MQATFTEGQWVWNDRLYGAAIIIRCCTNPGEDRETVVVQYIDWTYGRLCWGSETGTYEGYADTFVPIGQGPSIVREFLAAWDEAIAEDINRAAVAVERRAAAAQSEHVTQLRTALTKLVNLHGDWDKGSAYVPVAFMHENNAAIAEAREALAATTPMTVQTKQGARFFIGHESCRNTNNAPHVAVTAADALEVLVARGVDRNRAAESLMTIQRIPAGGMAVLRSVHGDLIEVIVKFGAGI